MENVDDDKTKRLAEERELARRQALYRTTEHPRKWDRFVEFQHHKFKSSVTETKRIFDCLGMVAFSASIFGFAVAAQLSLPLNELCERSISWSFVVLALLAFGTGVLAIQPMRYWASVQWGLSQKSNMKPFPFRLAGRRYGDTLIDGGVAVTYLAVLALAYSVASQIITRVPEQICLPPLP